MLVAGALATAAPAAAGAPGGLDGGFENGSRVVTHVPQPRISVGGLVPGPRGGLYVVANTERSQYATGSDGGTLLLVRYDRRGRPMRSFGDRGTYSTDLPAGPAKALGMVRQRDGKLVVVGSVGRRREGTQDAFIARFFPDGTLDGAFGSGGIRTLDLGENAEAANDATLLPGGGFAVVGTVSPELAEDGEPFLARLHPDGTPDTALGGDGVVRLATLSEQRGSTGEGVVVGRDGAIYFGGTTTAGPEGHEGPSPYLARLSAGALGAVADEAGLQASYFYGQDAAVSDLGIDGARGLVYLAGDAYYDQVARPVRMSVAAVRFDMALATGFGQGGVATVNFAGTPTDVANSVVVDERGRIVLAGAAVGEEPGGGAPRAQFAIARLTPRGVLDRSFGRRGRVRVRFRRQQNVAREVIQQRNGGLLVAGIGGGRSFTPFLGSGTTVALARFDGG